MLFFPLLHHFAAFVLPIVLCTFGALLFILAQCSCGKKSTKKISKGKTEVIKDQSPKSAAAGVAVAGDATPHKKSPLHTQTKTDDYIETNANQAKPPRKRRSRSRSIGTAPDPPPYRKGMRGSAVKDPCVLGAMQHVRAQPSLRYDRHMHISQSQR